MTNEVNEDVVVVADIVETKDDDGNDNTDWKALAEERHAQAVKNQGIAQRYKTKAEKAKETPANPVTPNEPSKSDELGSGEKALLVAYGIKGKDELELAKTWMKRTGDDIDALIEDSIFQAKLGGLREAKASADAIPKGTKRSSSSSVNDVDYWLAKGELPPDTADNRDLRTKIVEEQYKREKDSSPFKVGGNKLIIE